MNISGRSNIDLEKDKTLLKTLVPQFIEMAERAGASVEKIKSSPETINSILLKITAGSKNIVMSEPYNIPQSLFKLFKENADIIEQPNANQLASADFGISDAIAGVSSTGSICISIDSSLNNYISLLPKAHIAVLESNRIVARPRDIFEQYILKQPEKRGWVYISGPSATADMGELVRGAHGPAKLYIILLES